MKRGEALYEKTLHEIETLEKSGHGHLVHALENEAALVEALTVDLKIQIHDLNKTHAFHHLHVIEEELLHRENRISEELVIIQETIKNHQHQGHNDAALIAKGEELIKKAKAILAKDDHSREAHAIEAEMFKIEDLITAIKAKPNSPDLKKEEEQLARHEKTITQLIARLEHKGHK